MYVDQHDRTYFLTTPVIPSMFIEHTHASLFLPSILSDTGELSIHASATDTIMHG